jgi:methionyl-tRNA formyltransferase
MGSPEFAVPILERLAASYSVFGVVTQPDRPAGRGSRLRPPAIKVTAQELDLPVFQPRTLRTSDALERLQAWDPDLIVVAAFGQILPSSILDLPPRHCLNVHASLLPRWRGAAPIAAAIMAGDEVTGVTIMQMDEGLDTGPILSQREEIIRPDDTTDSLEERLSLLGAELLLDTLPPYLAGELIPQPQPEEGISLCRVLKKEDGRLDWTRTAVELDRQIRALTSWPGAFTTWKGKRLKVLRATPLPGLEGAQPPGTVIGREDGAAVATGEGALQLVEIQLAGKRAMPVEVFLHGQQDFIGSTLGQG